MNRHEFPAASFARKRSIAKRLREENEKNVRGNKEPRKIHADATSESEREEENERERRRDSGRREGRRRTEVRALKERKREAKVNLPEGDGLELHF